LLQPDVTFKAEMHQIWFRLGLCLKPRWWSLQRSTRPTSWISGVLLLRQGKGRGRRRGQEEIEGEDG